MKVSELIKALKKYHENELVSIRIKEDLENAPIKKDVTTERNEQATQFITTNWGADLSVLHSEKNDLYNSVIIEVNT